MSSTRAGRIRAALDAALAPVHLVLEDDSHKHAVPAGQGSHWNALIVSAAFEGRGAVARHRAVYAALTAELAAGLHALALTTLTPAEWEARGGGGPAATPPCHGGSAGP